MLPLLVLAALLATSCTSLPFQTQGVPPDTPADFVLQEGPFRVERYTRFTYSTYLDRAVSDHVVRILKDGASSFVGRPDDIPRSLVNQIADELARQRTFLALDVYGICLGTNVDDYPDLYDKQMDMEKVLYRYLRWQDRPDWNAFEVFAGQDGTIKQITLEKTFTNSAFRDRFFEAALDALAEKYFRVRTIEQQRLSLALEAGDSGQGAQGSYFGQTVDAAIISGVPSLEEFENQFYYHFQTSMSWRLSPYLEEDFQYIINPELGAIVLSKSDNKQSVLLSVFTRDMMQNEQRKNEAILKGF